MKKLKEKKSGVEIVKEEKNFLGIILRKECRLEGVTFFTPDNFSQQLAFMPKKKGEVIQAHIHNIIKREIFLTQETLIIRKGKIKVNFYDRNKKYLFSNILNKGDVILLADGGHGFEVMENSEIIEIKQGPYLKEDDKIKFIGVEKNNK